MTRRVRLRWKQRRSEEWRATVGHWWSWDWQWRFEVFGIIGGYRWNFECMCDNDMRGHGVATELGDAKRECLRQAVAKLLSMMTGETDRHAFNMAREQMHALLGDVSVSQLREHIE